MRIPLKYNLRNLLRRKARTSLTIGGIALVVAISVFMFAYARGVLRMTKDSGSPDNVIVLDRQGATHIFSSLKAQDYNHLKELPQIKKNILGEPLVCPETFHETKVDVGEAKGRPARIRGVSPMMLQVNDRIEYIEGEPPGPGRKIAVGGLVAASLGVPKESLAVGKKIFFQNAEWIIVGVFSTDGTALDAEIFADISDLMAAFNRATYSTAIMKVKDESDVKPLVDSLNQRNDIRVKAASEQDYYRGLAEGYERIIVLALAMALIAGLGGLVSGMNTMYASVVGRIREIGTLKVLGFRNHSIMASFVLESLFIATIGGVIGCAAGLTVNGIQTKFAAGAFSIRVDLVVLSSGMLVALLIGIIGALPPALRGLRLKITDALRYN